jgi:hypothetical protein
MTLNYTEHSVRVCVICSPVTTTFGISGQVIAGSDEVDVKRSDWRQGPVCAHSASAFQFDAIREHAGTFAFTRLVTSSDGL